MTQVVATGPGGDLTFSDLLAWLEGLKNPLSKIIFVAKDDLGFQSDLALWVYRPLKQIIKNYSNPLYDLVYIPKWLFSDELFKT